MNIVLDMANRNRNAGHKYELDILAKLKELFPDIVTSRNESRSMDAKKVDFCNTKPLTFNVSCLSINLTSGYLTKCQGAKM